MLKIILFILAFFFISSVLGQEPGKDQKRKQNLEVSGAELIVRFQKLNAEDQQRLIQLNSRSKQLERRIADLTLDYEQLDSKLSINSDSTVIAEMDRILNSLDFYLRSLQALSQQIVLVKSKIGKQKELVTYITMGKVPMSEDSIKNVLSIADTVEQTATSSETQNRKELAALQNLGIKKAELMHSRKNLLLVDQLIRMHEQDFELTQQLFTASSGLRTLYKNNSNQSGSKRNLGEITRRFSQDSALLTTLNTRIKMLNAYRPPIVKAVGQAENEVENAQSQLEFLQSSIAPSRVIYWLKTNLPSIALIILVFFMIWIASRWVVKLILNKFIKSRRNAESADRLETLKLASGSIITILVVLIGFLVLLSQIGVDITVVLGGAAVLSLVIALGAQSLVKDYLSGFIILLENQYRAGNVVEINQTTGVVENMSLRLTVLRDLEGITHFIPHGQINNVSNLTHQWSRVMLEIGVSYNENVDHVISVLEEIGAQMKEDPEYGSIIIGDLDMLGVDKFAESAVVIKFLIKTWPLKQWIVKRELLRRIKNRFDELGIEIPFPHLTIYHRQTGKVFENGINKPQED